MTNQVEKQINGVEYFPTYLLPVYHQSIGDMFAIATRMGVSIVDADKQAWHLLAYTARAFDTAVDVNKATTDDLKNMVAELKEGRSVDGYSSDLAGLFAQLFPLLPEEKRNLIEFEVPDLASIAQQLRGVKSVTELIDLKRTEAGILSEMLSLDKLGLKDDSSRDSYNRFVKKCIFAGYLIDTAVDIKKDIGDGLLPKMDSIVATRLRLLTLAIQETVQLRGVWNPTSVNILARMVLRSV